MTFAVVFKGSDGLALAADSRITLTTTQSSGQRFFSHFDNATKVLSFQGQPYVGAVMFGQAAIGSPPRTVHGFITEFEQRIATHFAVESAPQRRGTVLEIATQLGEFYSEQWQQAGMPPVGTGGVEPIVFLVAGFDEGSPYGSVYEVIVPTAPQPVEKDPGTQFGLRWGGQKEVVCRLINGYDQRILDVTKAHLSLDDDQAAQLEQKWQSELGLSVPYQFLPLQDCVDLSAFLVNMTASVQRWTVGVQGVGGAVDVATITRADGFQIVRQKKIELSE